MEKEQFIFDANTKDITIQPVDSYQTATEQYLIVKRALIFDELKELIDFSKKYYSNKNKGE